MPHRPRRAVHLPRHTCQRGCEYILLMAYVTDNIRFVSGTFSPRRYSFAYLPRRPLSLSLSLSLSRGCSQGFPCDEKPGDNDKVSHGRAGDVARPFNVAPLLAEIAAAGGVAINFLKTQARPFGLRMRIAHARLVPFETEERKGRKATRFRGCQIRE